MIETDWQARHPFAIGQVVYVRPWSVHAGLDPARGRPVHMRGESDAGLWIAFAGLPMAFPVSDFTAVPPLPPVVDDAQDEEAA